MSSNIEPGYLLKERYIIRKVIGRGGMGSIYLSEDNRLPGRLCAIKEVEHGPEIPDSLRSQSQDQFYREASVLARLDHPNLPKVSDYFSEEKHDYLVMDFVPGQDLKTLMDQSRRRNKLLDLADVLQWAVQLLSAMEYLHEQDPPVIHRDIKPSNLKVTPSGLIKLVDFGLVKQMAPDEMTITVIQGRGTAHYTPLEQYGGDTGHTDPRSDIYSFGATLYHLLTNSPPAEAKERFLKPDILKKPSALNPKIDSNLERTLLWALALHPDERPRTAAALKQSLLEESPKVSRMLEPITKPNLFESVELDTVERSLTGVGLFLLLVAILTSLT